MEDRRKGLPLHTKIFIALLMGAVAGVTVQALGFRDHVRTKWVIDNLANPVGDIFLSLIFMIVVPLLFSALVLGVAEIGSAKNFGKIGLSALGMTVLLSGIAVVLGLTLVNAVKPGSFVTQEERVRIMAEYGDPKKSAEMEAKAKEGKSAAQTIAEIVPKNPFKEAVEGNYLPFMFFALMFGLALSAIEAEKAAPLRTFFDSVFAVSLKVIEFAMKFAPFGVFALIFRAAATLGIGAVSALGSYFLLVLIALAIQQFGVYALAIRFIAKRNPIEYFRQIKGMMLTAFSTSSSNATLPTALRTAEDEVGLPREISNFVLTIGATANQNGTALFEGVTILFLAQFFGVDLTTGQQVIVMLMAILGGIGTAGVPGGSWPMIGAIMLMVGVPIEGVGLCMGIDRLLDMSRTVINVSGDMTIAACVARIVGRTDEELAAAAS